MTPRILVTGAGGPSAIAVMNSLSSYAIYAGDADRLASGLYSVPSHRRLLLPKGDAPEFARIVWSECQKHRIDVLIPTVDAELIPLALEHRTFSDAGTLILNSPVDRLRTCLDKFLLLQYARHILPTPRFALCHNPIDFDDWEFPVIATPRRGSGVRRVESQRELADLPTDGSMLICEYLPGTEYSVDVLASTRGQPLATVPKERSRIDSGISVTSRTVKDQQLELYARTIVAELTLPYVSNVQFRRDKFGTARLFEINPRFPGSMALTVASGIDMPKHALDLLFGTFDRKKVTPFGVLAMVRYLGQRFVSVETVFGDAQARESVRPLHEHPLLDAC